MIAILKNTKPIIRLGKVGETDSKRTWIFTFIEPRHKFIQSVIVMKDIQDVAYKMEEAYEKIYVSWQEKIREQQWKTGRWN